MKNLLKPLRDGELKGDMLPAVRTHLASCPACRSGLSPQDLIEILPVFDESIEPSADFAVRFYSELQARRDRKDPAPGELTFRTKPSWFPEWSWRPAAAAAALVVILSVGLYVQKFRESAPDASTVFYEMEITDNLALFRDMDLIEDLEFFEDLDVIENLPQLN